MARTPHSKPVAKNGKLKLTRKMKNIGKAFQARRHGAKHARTIADEASRAGIPYAVAFALCEQESGFRNVFGHDQGGMYQGLPVTKDRVQEMLRRVHNGAVSNGVGYTQLTWVGFIAEAEKLGGAHKIRYQCRVGFGIIATSRKSGRSWFESFKSYNGTGALAINYAHTMEARVAKWEKFLEGWRKGVK